MTDLNSDEIELFKSSVAPRTSQSESFHVRFQYNNRLEWTTVESAEYDVIKLIELLSSTPFSTFSSTYFRGTSSCSTETVKSSQTSTLGSLSLCTSFDDYGDTVVTPPRKRTKSAAVSYHKLTDQVKIWFQNRRMKWRNSKERELLAAGGSREQTLPSKNNPHSDLSDASEDKPKLDLSDVPDISPVNSPMERQRSSGDDKTNPPGNARHCITSQNYQLYENMEYESSTNDSEEEINVT